MMSRWIRVGCDFRYLAEADTPVIFQVQPGRSPSVAFGSEQWSSEPAIEIHSYSDLYGNLCARAVLPAGRSSFRYQAVAAVPDATEDANPGAPERPAGALPDDALIYTLPSRYCLPDVLGDEAWCRFGSLVPGYGPMTFS